LPGEEGGPQLMTYVSDAARNFSRPRAVGVVTPGKADHVKAG